jgi:hypothetical protein
MKMTLVFSIAFILVIFTAFADDGSVTENALTIDLGVTVGDMIPKTGWLLVPNKDIPDGRIIPLNTRYIRDDIETQNLIHNHAGANTYIRMIDILPYELNRLARLRDGVARVKELGIPVYYPVLAYMPSWMSSTGMSIGNPTDYALWRQWVKDIAQYVKDNSLDIDEFNVWNENWGITEAEYNRMHEEAWWAFKDIRPDARLIGPSPSKDKIEPIVSLINHSVKADIPIETLSWHFGAYRNMDSLLDTIQTAVENNPSVGDPAYYYEEYDLNGIYFSEWAKNGRVNRFGEELEIISKFDGDTRISAAIRGIWEYTNGLSDMLVTDNNQENIAARRKQWWLMTAYGAMSGQRVRHTGSTPYVASVDVDKGEAKILVGGQNLGTVDFTLANNPFAGSDVHVDTYRLVGDNPDGTLGNGDENDGIRLQGSVSVRNSSKSLTVSISFAAQDVWLIVVKKETGVPSDFALMTPDDNALVSAGADPTLTWQKARGAASYDLAVSLDRDMSSPVYTRAGITGESHTVTGVTLQTGQKYYWTVTAVNASGTRVPYNGMYYSFTPVENTDVPGGFILLQVVNGATDVSLTPKFSWCESRNVSNFLLYISRNGAFSDPKIITVTNPPLVDVTQGHRYLHYTLTAAEALKPATRYYAKVEAVNANGTRKMNGTLHTFTTTTADEMPAAFALTTPSNGSTLAPRSTLRWKRTPGANFYELEIARDAGFTDLVLTRPYITVEAYTLEPELFAPETTYYWRITAASKDKTRKTPNSGGVYSFTMSGLPAAPTVRTATPVPGGALISFQPVPGVDFYTVKYGSAPGVYTEVLTGVTGAKVVLPLQGAGPWYCAVEAVRGGKVSGIWNELKIKNRPF